MKKLIRYFLQGLIYITPISLTIYIIYWIIKNLESWSTGLTIKYLQIDIPGIGILIAFLAIALLGFIGSTIIFVPIKKLFNKFLKKAPLVNLIYSSINDLMKSIFGAESMFTKPVIAKVSRMGEYEKIGFITQEDLTDFGVKDKVSVYFPHSYAWSGELFIIPTKDVRLLDVPAAEVMKYILSGGATRV